MGRQAHVQEATRPTELHLWNSHGSNLGRSTNTPGLLDLYEPTRPCRVPGAFLLPPVLAGIATFVGRPTRWRNRQHNPRKLPTKNRVYVSNDACDWILRFRHSCRHDRTTRQCLRDIHYLQQRGWVGYD